MSPKRLPPPPNVDCLEQPYLSSQKGGTLIAEDVFDLETHLTRLCDPDGYRPQYCHNCAHQVLHVHDYRDRVLVSDPDSPTIRVVRYLCVGCRATWRILPGFIARHLWRSWRVVEANCIEEKPPLSWPKVPERTRRRWKARLRTASNLLVKTLLTSGAAPFVSLANSLDQDTTREQVVSSYAAMFRLPIGQHLAALAALIHRLAPGGRVM
jgi:hypothetical protein